MNRRELLKTLTGTGVAALIPASVSAATNTRTDSAYDYEGFVVELRSTSGTVPDDPMISYSHKLGVASNNAWRFYRTREEGREYIDNLRRWRDSFDSSWMESFSVHTGKVVGWKVLRADAPRNDSAILRAVFPTNPKQEMWIPNTHGVNKEGENPRQAAEWFRGVLMRSNTSALHDVLGTKYAPNSWPIYWVEPVLEDRYVSWFNPQDRQFYGRVWGS